jgi:hypothetical protein
MRKARIERKTRRRRRFVSGELHDGRAAGGTAGEADGGHGRLRAGRDQADLVDGGDARADRFGQLDLARRRCAEGRALGRRPLHRLDDRRVRVPEDRRAPRLHVVDVAVAVGVFQAGALTPRDEKRFATDRAERADRRVHAARYTRLRAREPRGHGSGTK